jgi:peroxiredoxin
MKKTTVLLLALLISAAAFALSPAPKAEKAADFSLRDMSGRQVSLNAYKGKAVLLAFFQTTCPACQDELPQLEPLYQKYRSKNFDIIAVSIRESADTVRLFARKNKLSFTVLLDYNAEASRAYKVRYIPRIFIVDRSGNITFSSYSIPAADLEKEIKKAAK